MPGGIPTARRAFYVGSVGYRQSNSDPFHVKHNMRIYFYSVVEKYPQMVNVL